MSRSVLCGCATPFPHIPRPIGRFGPLMRLPKPVSVAPSYHASIWVMQPLFSTLRPNLRVIPTGCVAETHFRSALLPRVNLGCATHFLDIPTESEDHPLKIRLPKPISPFQTLLLPSRIPNDLIFFQVSHSNLISFQSV